MKWFIWIMAFNAVFFVFAHVFPRRRQTPITVTISGKDAKALDSAIEKQRKK